jgi:hypothetical protein
MSPRHFVTVPDSDEDIIEEVNYLRKTKKGMKTTTKRVPMTHPPQAKAGDAARSRHKGSRHTQVHRAEDTPQEGAHIGDMDTHEFIDGYEDNIPGAIMEEVQPQVMVRLHVSSSYRNTDSV